MVTEVRIPTDTWSGLGFSKSMPAEAVKELRNISRRSYKPYLSSSTQQQVQNKLFKRKIELHFNKQKRNLKYFQFELV